MPMRRRFRRRRAVRRGGRKPRPSSRNQLWRDVGSARSAMKRIYYYKQTILNPTGIGPIGQTGGAGDFLAAYNFQLSQAGGNVGPFTSLYDQYCIKKIVFKLVPKFTTSDMQVGASLGGEIPNVVTAMDYDDSNPPASYGDILQRQNAKLVRSNRVITRVFKPACNFVVDATVGALSQKFSPWLDISNINCPHYGIKLGIQGLPTGVDCNYDTVVTYYLAFKQVR